MYCCILPLQALHYVPNVNLFHVFSLPTYIICFSVIPWASLPICIRLCLSFQYQTVYWFQCQSVSYFVLSFKQSKYASCFQHQSVSWFQCQPVSYFVLSFHQSQFAFNFQPQIDCIICPIFSVQICTIFSSLFPVPFCILFQRQSVSVICPIFLVQICTMFSSPLSSANMYLFQRQSVSVICSIFLVQIHVCTIYSFLFPAPICIRNLSHLFTANLYHIFLSLSSANLHP